ncbi:hypothetical protein BYI23_E002330 (plasmid) [Burkholderia sp. YI23]|nr:hypothetical protein BYI23_E002330 [Burkholderia sp. YI23]
MTKVGKMTAMAVHMRGWIGVSDGDRRVTVKLELAPCRADVATTVMSIDYIEALWERSLADAIEDDESVGQIDWVEMIGERGRPLGAALVRFGSMCWELGADITSARFEECERRVFCCLENGEDASYYRALISAAEDHRSETMRLAQPAPVNA